MKIHHPLSYTANYLKQCVPFQRTSGYFTWQNVEQNGVKIVGKNEETRVIKYTEEQIL